MLVVGPALYLIGHGLFRLRMAGTVSWKRMGGALACLAVGALGSFAPALVLAALLVAILVTVIVAEHAACLAPPPARRAVAVAAPGRVGSLVGGNDDRAGRPRIPAVTVPPRSPPP